MRSMTGYAYCDSIVHNTDISCELKSYNSRFFDLTINVPQSMAQLEPFLRKFLTRHIIRGKVDFYLRIKKTYENQAITPNISLARSYYRSVSEIARSLGMEDQVSLDLILRQEGILQMDRTFNADQWQQDLQPILDLIIEHFNRTRIEEGKALKADMQKMLTTLSQAIEEIETNAAQMEAIFSATLKKRFAELLEHEPDEQRVMQEIAVLLVKYTINEEIIRAKAHINALQKEITENETPGRKIDFLCQEINREVNTIGSKNQLTAIGQAVIAAKDALENIREQAHNVE
ncbi:MAG: YicC/YloC family endoribonuclease [Treponema sp.]|uniref:YicC/YloC family endoribonuclease n=1 Tax=Treponema sp. TaxID=166 RepID=UPI003FA2F6CF